MPREILVLFVFFAAFVFVNFAIYLFLHLKLRERLFKELSIYWLLVLLVFVIEGGVQEGKFALSLIFIINIFPIYILARFLMNSYGLKLNLKRYIAATIGVTALTIVSNYFDMSFQFMAIPVATVAAFPLLQGIYATFVTKKEEATFIQKFMAVLLFMGVICCYHYAISRMTPGRIEIGFGTAFLNYIAASIILPVFAIQELNKEKTERLEHLVKERTTELLASKIQKEKLLRVVVHDISNALQVLILQTSRLSLNEDPKVVEASTRLMKNLDAITAIAKHVKDMEYSKSGGIKLAPVSIGECFEEVRELFSERFENKNVTLVLENKVPDGVLINVDRVTFIHSLASNIISNALKFSYPGSEVVVTAYEDQGEVNLVVQDYGVGMSEKFLAKLFEFEASFTTLGTQGERGTGFGMPLVKNYTEIFGGTVYASSSQNPEASGTRIHVSLPAIVNSSRDQATSLN